MNNTSVIITNPTNAQRKFLTLNSNRAISISGDDWDGLVQMGLIENDLTRLVLTEKGREISNNLSC